MVGYLKICYFLKVFNKAQVAIANVKQMIDVIAGELVWSVVDPKVSIWRQGEVETGMTDVGDQQNGVT